MTRLPRLENAHELLDDETHAPGALETSLDHVAGVNRWLGGRLALLRHLPALLPPPAGATAYPRGAPDAILDAGTGSADLPLAIARWARRHGRAVRITAADVHPAILDIARRRTAVWPEIECVRADVLRLPFDDGSFDAALLSLTLHHFEGEDQVTALRELGRVARRGVLVGELERSWPAYIGAKLLAATVWRHDPITRHDGPVSVRRAFTPSELLDLARRAGLPRPRIHRHPLFRLVLVAGAPTP